MDKSKLQLYFIAGTTNIGDRNLLDVLQAALKGGITTFQLREKGEGALQGDDLKALAEQCKQLCNKFKVPFIVNDDVDLAVEVGADGVHIGQEDGDIAKVREKIGSEKILGVSTHSIEDAMAASDAGANYVGIGPLFETTSKENAGAPVGTELVRQVANVLPGLPIVGIGGITERKAGRVIREGASGVAMISAIANSEDVEQVTRAIKGSVTLASTGVEM
ncbi:thiamine phosphate synthase [Sporosarcina pasteurii]|uniref:Thiamine-phosphate synthase n=1 Tax=Sporosarcina pasteurii TaxID=1474 RepID=A0A380CKM0_SPOPA|nr:thiamine phosphate synthase [Sporosarcina pasteurii]MDS9471954.1 thiamine phosphate synthase [Sporosarcina pasteurii]QBQ06685.1 thiamine phosphate synthase [Sporosarcina pasteurii]SUJ21820.1 Thiamine-phosphate synthase [Sporosarcina pasteurii]